MKIRILGIFLILLSIFLGILAWKLPEWNRVAFGIFENLELKDASSLSKAQEKSLALPSFWPYSSIKKSLNDVVLIEKNIYKMRSELPMVLKDLVDLGRLDKSVLSEYTSLFDETVLLVSDIESRLVFFESFSGMFLSESEREKMQDALGKIEEGTSILSHLQDVLGFVNLHKKNGTSVFVALQNPNEPRSTGGFMGSGILITADDRFMYWKFLDIYALDRNIEEKDMIPAPDFFHGLAARISLRDANFWADFPTSAQHIRGFFEKADETPPKTVVMLDLQWAKALLEVTGPVLLPQWNLTLDSGNFDTGIQFLVESKIAGKYNVKSPLLAFMKTVLAQAQSRPLNAWKKFDLKGLVEQKNILGHSEILPAQNFFERHNIDGRLDFDPLADDFLHFEFVSIGANKSEKFVWTDIRQDVKILTSGVAQKKLHITRHHKLNPGEIQDLLGTDSWPTNIRNLLTGKLLWILGEGQNRTIIRVWVPSDSVLGNYENPSGEVVQNDYFFEFPMHILPGEKITTTIEYFVPIDRGSTRWRPYFLDLKGTPGRAKTNFLMTITTEKNGSFEAETFNIGRPTDLIDQHFRALIKYPAK